MLEKVIHCGYFGVPRRSSLGLKSITLYPQQNSRPWEVYVQTQALICNLKVAFSSEDLSWKVGGRKGLFKDGLVKDEMDS